MATKSEKLTIDIVSTPISKIQKIPLTKLTAWSGNVRKTSRKAGIEELAASIKAHGPFIRSRGPDLEFGQTCPYYLLLRPTREVLFPSCARQYPRNNMPVSVNSVNITGVPTYFVQLKTLEM